MKRTFDEAAIARGFDAQISQGVIARYFRPSERAGRDTWLIIPAHSADTAEMTTAEAHAFVIGLRVAQIDADWQARHPEGTFDREHTTCGHPVPEHHATTWGIDGEVFCSLDCMAAADEAYAEHQENRRDRAAAGGYRA